MNHLTIMALLSRSAFQRLSESAQDPAVSIYLPTHMAGPDSRQDPIRLKNLLATAETRLQQGGLPQEAAAAMLKPGVALLEDQGFWRYQSQGLALFFTPERLALHRLPLTFEPLVVVGDRFHLKPLLPLFFDNPYFYLLALSQNQVRFFQATRFQISEIPLAGVPTSRDQALQYDDPEKQLQFHSGNAGSGQPIYHGQGGGRDDQSDLRRFLLQVDSGLHPYLNQDAAPLVLAAVDYVQALYRQINTYPHLLETGITGNPDATPPEALREQGWAAVAPLLEQSHHQALEQYRTLAGTAQAGDRLAQLLPAAHRGQVETLFVAAQAHRWGAFDPEAGTLETHDLPQPRDRDLLDLAAVQTFLQGGQVYLLEASTLPSSEPIAAIYRYPLPAAG